MEILALLLTGAFALTFVAFTEKPKSRKAKAQAVRVRSNHTRQYELRRRGWIR